MANILTELKSFKLKHVSPLEITTQRKRKSSLELHLASALEKRFKLIGEVDEESNDEW
jgi:hypothetical protein